jgi:hypothetical protein
MVLNRYWHAIGGSSLFPGGIPIRLLQGLIDLDPVSIGFDPSKRPDYRNSL